MKYTLKYYVDSIFEGTPDTEAVRELHDEILSNLEARYDDCISGGMTPQRAYAAVIGTMGDVSGLIDQVCGSGYHVKGSFEKQTPFGRLLKKYSYIFTEKNIRIIKRTVIAVMWLLITTIFLVGCYVGYFEYLWMIFPIGAALNVGINMAGNIARISRGGDNDKTRIRLLKTVRSSTSAIMWIMLAMLYIMLSIESDEWGITWVIFLLGAAVQIIINTVFKIQINRYKE